MCARFAARFSFAPRIVILYIYFFFRLSLFIFANIDCRCAKHIVWTGNNNIYLQREKNSEFLFTTVSRSRHRASHTHIQRHKQISPSGTEAREKRNSGRQLRRRRCYFTLILQIIRLLPKQIDRKQIDLFSFDLFHVYFAIQIRSTCCCFFLFFSFVLPFFCSWSPFSRESRS